MDASLDLSRWRQRPRGVGYRRWVIVSTGLRRLNRMWFFRALLFISWSVGLILAATGFLFSQSVAVGGGLDSFLGSFGPRGAAIASTMRALVLLYPDVVVNSLFTLIFWLQANVALLVSLFALTAMIPSLVTRDRVSNALTVYLSRPLTSADYLLGKLGTIAGVLLLVWTGPLLFTWLASILFASDRDFVLYSFGPLVRALLFNGIALIALSAIAMGVSALTRSARTTIVVWLGLWLVAGFIANVPRMPLWMQHASFSHDLREVRGEVIQIDRALSEAGEELPLTNQRLAESLRRGGERTAPTGLGGSIVGLAALTGLASLSLLRRLKPE
jgi:ABC-2 type transport system permease protein